MKRNSWTKQKEIIVVSEIFAEPEPIDIELRRIFVLTKISILTQIYNMIDFIPVFKFVRLFNSHIELPKASVF